MAQAGLLAGNADDLPPVDVIKAATTCAASNSIAQHEISTVEPWRAHGWREAVYENRRRVTREKGKQLQRRRAEVVERTFAHVCATGGSRRTWIRGLGEVSKRYLVTVMAHNLGVILRALIGVGNAREYVAMRAFLAAWHRFWSTIVAELRDALHLLGRTSDHEAFRSAPIAKGDGLSKSLLLQRVARGTGRRREAKPPDPERRSA